MLFVARWMRRGSEHGTGGITAADDATVRSRSVAVVGCGPCQCWRRIGSSANFPRIKVPQATEMKTARIETWVWILVYVGLIVFGLGLSVRHSDASFGAVVAMIGGLLVAAGVLLIWLRSRMSADKHQP